MSFSFNSLVRVATCNGVGVFVYKTNDTKATVEGANYFDDVVDMLPVGSIIHVAGDLDGTPFHTSYVVSANDGSTPTLTEHAAVTQNVLQVVTLRVTALGTASNHYVASPIAGSIVAAYGVSNGNNGTASSTIDILTDAGVKATLTFSDSYTAGTGVSDTSVSANTLTAGEVIHIDNNGEGDGTGEAIVTLVIEPA